MRISDWSSDVCSSDLTEEEAFACARRFLSYLPSSVYEVSPRTPCEDDPKRREEKLFEIVPRDRRRVYKMRAIIDAVVDENSFFEMGRMYGRPIITGFARLDGVPVALMASDPYFFAGAWTADACRKIVRSEEHTSELQSLMRN